ncbi:MAG: response regulator [Syntrophaceae bacterium]|nr:response regulator [Syntrophaceae bacterium]
MKREEMNPFPWRNMKIGHRLVMVLGFALGSMVFVWVLGISNMNRMKDKMDSILQVNNAKIWHANMIRDAVHTIDKALLITALSPDEIVRSMEYVKILTSRESLQTSLTELERLEQTERGRDLLDRLKKAVEKSRSASDRILMGDSPKIGAGPGHDYMISARPVLQQLQQICAELVIFEKEQSDLLYWQTEDAYFFTRNLSAAVGGGICLAAGLMIFFLTRSITGPLRQGVEVANQLAEGDLSAEIRVDRGDEAGQLLSAMKNLSEKLREVRNLERQLQQSQKLETIGRLAGGVAHDFNNILSVINCHAQLCLMELAEGDRFQESFQEIKEAGDKAASLTKQLLAFSSRQIMELRVLDLNGVIRNLQKMLRRLIGEDIELQTHLTPDLGTVKADVGQIEQVILNLAVNARDAMPKGGRLLIETGNVEFDAAISQRHVSVKPGKYVMLSVSDTGIGMTPEVQSRIFEPFFTTKEKGKGTGLGLATVYGIVTQSLGHIRVYSEPGHGATFKLYFPRLETLEEEKKEKSAQGQIPKGAETILVVEDEEKVRNLVLRILRKQGYQVLEASNGFEALELRRRYEGRIDLLMTDVVMPGMGGVDLAEQLRPFCKDLKVLFLSGHTDRALSDQQSLPERSGYLSKPFSVEKLANQVREILDS